MATTRAPLIGLLLGAETDWPQAFEEILRRVGPVTAGDTTYQLSSERLRIHPFDLTDPVRPGLVIDQLAYWYYHPREWLKKAALTHDTYLLNSPFTFQSMEKHSAYCAMLRLGLKVPGPCWCPTRTRSTTCAGPTRRSSTTTPSTWTPSPPTSATRCT